MYSLLAILKLNNNNKYCYALYYLRELYKKYAIRTSEDRKHVNCFSSLAGKLVSKIVSRSKPSWIYLEWRNWLRH